MSCVECRHLAVTEHPRPLPGAREGRPGPALQKDSGDSSSLEAGRSGGHRGSQPGPRFPGTDQWDHLLGMASGAREANLRERQLLTSSVSPPSPGLGLSQSSDGTFRTECQHHPVWRALKHEDLASIAITDNPPWHFPDTTLFLPKAQHGLQGPRGPAHQVGSASRASWAPSRSWQTCCPGGRDTIPPEAHRCKDTKNHHVKKTLFFKGKKKIVLWET